MEKVSMQLRLDNIHELEYRYRATPRKMMKYKGEPVHVNLSVSVYPDLHENLLELVTGVQYVVLEDGFPEELLTYKIALLYWVCNLSQYVQAQHQKVSVSSELLSIMLGVGVGSLRGMLTLRTDKTVFSHFPLPIINISHVIATMKGDVLQNNAVSPIFRFKYE